VVKGDRLLLFTLYFMMEKYPGAIPPLKTKLSIKGVLFCSNCLHCLHGIMQNGDTVGDKVECWLMSDKKGKKGSLSP